MFKALVKKQLLEVNKGYFTDQKTGNRKSKKATMLYILLFLGIFGFIGISFVYVCKTLIDAFHPVGLDWLYFSITAVLSVMLGTFGSVFSTYAGLYKAEDNDFLLSLPIKPHLIVSSKLIGVFLTGLIYELPVIIPAVIVYWTSVGATISHVLIQLLGIFVIALLILAISCIFGYIVALVSTRIKNKSFLSAIATVLFLVLYYAVYFKINALIKNIVNNADVVGQKIKSSTFFLYHLGNGLNGSIKSLLIVSVITVTVALIVFIVLERNFVKLASSEQSQTRGKMKAKITSEKKPKVALLKKELKRFTSSAVYLMNCGLGIIIMPVGAVITAIKADVIISTVNEISVDAPNIKNILPMLVTAVICIICALNAVTAPSVSLEGKNIWVTQSLPVDTGLILDAKVNLGVMINSVPALVSTLIVCIVLKLEVLSIILSLSTVWLYIWLISRLGLMMNLKFPKLNWTNETVPIKQSMSLILSLLIGWLLAAGMFLLSVVAASIININFFMIAVVVALILANILFDKWIKNKGTVIFENL